MQNIFTFHIEPVRGCTRRCDFCGINSIKNEKTVFMSIEMAKSIAFQIKKDFKQKIRIDFSLHGEPLLHPKIYEIIKIFREELLISQLSIISNADLIAKNKIDIIKLFDSGLNYLMIDLYNRKKEEYKIIYNNFDNVLESDASINYYDYFEDGKSIWRYNGYKEKGLIIVKDLSKTNVITRKVHTAGGNLMESVYEKYGIDSKKFPILKQCAKPFTELSINADGNVSLCCEDWSRKNILGNVLNDKLIDIWSSDKIEKYRYLLYKKRRDLIEVCKKCDQISFRTGLYKPEKEFPELLK